MTTRQTTITVDDQKITIKSRLRTRARNPIGYRVWINGNYTDWFTLDRLEAEGKALNRWIDINGVSS